MAAATLPTTLLRRAFSPLSTLLRAFGLLCLLTLHSQQAKIMSHGIERRRKSNNERETERNAEAETRYGHGLTDADCDPDNAIDDGLKNILESAISEDYLRQVAGSDDLTTVTFMQLRVDLNIQSILDITDNLPSLTSLILDESIISSVRDLGTGLRSIISLSLNSCALKDLDGIGVLTGLQDFNASDNYLTDAAPLAMHENLQVCNLSGNNIFSISLADELNSCPQLKQLFLGRNPITRAENYRLVMAYLIPQLDRLDGTPVNKAEAAKVTNNMVLETASELRELQEELEEEERTLNSLQNTGSGSNHGSMQSLQGGANGQNMSTSLETTGNERMSPREYKKASASMGGVPDTGSELTHGSTVVLAGNMAAAMRRRSRNNVNNNSNNNNGSSNNSRPSSGPAIEDITSDIWHGEGDITASYLSQPLNGGESPDKAAARNGHLRVTRAAIEEHNENNRSYDRNGNRSSSNWASQENPGTNRRGNSDSWVDATVLGTGNASTRTSVDSQRNSFAQQGVVDTTAAPTMRSAPSAPFKIAADANDLKQLPFHNSRGSSAGSDRDKDPVWKVDRTQTGHRAEDKGATNTNDMEGYAYEYHNGTAESGSGTNARNTSIVDAEKQRFGKTKSYIHKDMVVRSGAHTQANGVDSEFDEDISVSASVRHAMMATNNMKAYGTPDKKSKSPHSKSHVLPSSNDEDDDDDDDEKVFSTAGHGAAMVKANTNSLHSTTKENNNNSSKGKSAAASTSQSDAAFPTKGVASMVGASLGFNLQESLAAIDQWVDDMESDSASGGYQTPDDYGTDGGEEDDHADTHALLTGEKALITSYAELSPAQFSNGSSAAVEFSSPFSSGLDSAIHTAASQALGGGRSNSGNSNSEGFSPSLLQNSSNGNSASVLSSETSFPPMLLSGFSRRGERPRSGASSRTGSAGSSRSERASTASHDSRILTRDAIFSMCSGGERLDDVTDKVPSSQLYAAVGGWQNTTGSSSKGGQADSGDKTEKDRAMLAAQKEDEMNDYRNKRAAAVTAATRKEALNNNKGSPNNGSGVNSSSKSVLNGYSSNSHRDIVSSSNVPKSSPPRVDAEDEKSTISGGGGSTIQQGPAVALSDHDLVVMLQRPPKAVPQLRTKTGYIDFFRGMPAKRMELLLTQAYHDMEPTEREAKVHKRMTLIAEILV